MRFTELAVAGAYKVELEPVVDERGMFARAWCAREFAARGLEPQIAQINLSTNVSPGTIRGLHAQTPPHAEAKFLRCIAGRSFHAIVDLRPASRSYGAWAGVELAAERFDALYVPAYCADGYQALEDATAVLFAVSVPHTPGAKIGVRWDDPAFGIEWPITRGVIVAPRDANWPDFRLERRSPGTRTVI